MGILLWIVFGLIAGALAKFLMPGRQPGGGHPHHPARPRRRGGRRLRRHPARVRGRQQFRPAQPGPGGRRRAPLARRLGARPEGGGMSPRGTVARPGRPVASGRPGPPLSAAVALAGRPVFVRRQRTLTRPAQRPARLPPGHGPLACRPPPGQAQNEEVVGKPDRFPASARRPERLPPLVPSDRRGKPCRTTRKAPRLRLPRPNRQ